MKHLLPFALFSFLLPLAHLQAIRTTDHKFTTPRRPILEDTIAVINGDEVEDNEESLKDGSFAVGMLYIKDGPKKNKFGTATALCPNVVLTAAHVAEHLKHGMDFVMGKNAKDDYEKGRRRGRKAIEVFNLREGNGAATFVGDTAKTSDRNLYNQANDIALVKIEPPLPAKQFKFAKLAHPGPIPDRDLEVLGYGKFSVDAKFDDPGEAGTRRSGRFRARRIVWAKDESYGTMMTRADRRMQFPSSADSGAPIYRTDELGERGAIVAVHTNGSAEQPGKEGWAAVTGPHYEKLQKKLKEWCPAP